MNMQPISQKITEGGLPAELDRLWRLCRYSNDIACAAYNFEMLNIYENDKQKFHGLDLNAVECSGRYIPTLRDGSNNYSQLSNKLLDVNDIVFQGLSIDLMLIIPEANRLINGTTHDLGLVNALSKKQNRGKFRIIDALSIIPCREEKLDLLRAFDSHPSSGTYFFCIEHILRCLGYENVSYDITFNFPEYVCDLASRFSNHAVRCMFASGHHFVRDASKLENRNTGIHRVFENSNAPIRQKILLIGDSHSASALALMCSFVFEHVRFLWASRRDNYSPFSDEVYHFSREADFVVEEMAERFFLSNFCTPLE